ncbi:hypothetical protein WT53_17145 [Burkholderia sp. MSMB2157WGS]|nr:hypothetical protein WT53_17145 [Burkholderia sp. MSMB2157WGS]
MPASFSWEPLTSAIWPARSTKRRKCRTSARITAFGLGGHATKDAEKYVRAMNTMGVSTSDNMTLMRDAWSIFADEHHAQMVMPTLSKMKFASDLI